MQLLSGILVILHLIGVASLLGGFLGQMKDLKTGGSIVPGMLHGAWLLLITASPWLALLRLAVTST